MRIVRLLALSLVLLTATDILVATPSRDTGVRLLSMDALAAASLPAEHANISSDPSLRTFRVERENRPARVVAGPQRLSRRLVVPAGGGRFETQIAPIGGDAVMRVSLEGAETPLAVVTAQAGRWTPVVAELQRPGALSSEVNVIEELVVPRDRCVLWGDDRLVPLQPQTDRPDVLVISLDTVRSDYLTPYAPQESTTPSLASLAKEAIRFDQAISVTSWTMPAHAALLTGRYPSLELGFSERLDPAQLTLAEIFSAAGYNTQGASGGPYTDSDFGFQQGFRAYLDSSAWKNAELITDWALRRVTRSTRGTPLFLFLNYFDAHEPNTGITAAEWQALDSGKTALDDAMRDRIHDGYRHDLRSIDRQLARLFDAIRRSRDWDNTVIIVVSDHGQLLGERGFVGHALTLEEELIRVPLMVKPARGVRPARQVYREQFQLTDVFSLIAELAGVDAGVRAPLLARVLAGEPVRPLTFAQVHHPVSPALTSLPRWHSTTMRAVRTDSSKVVRDAEGRVVTYRVGAAGETPSPRSALTERLLAELDTFERRQASEPTMTAPLVLGREMLDRLRALGYIR